MRSDFTGQTQDNKLIELNKGMMMKGFKEYHVKICQNDRQQNLSGSIDCDVDYVSMQVWPIDYDESKHETAKLAENILKHTRELNRVYDTRHEADLAGQLLAPVIKEAYLALGYPVWGVTYRVREGATTYKVEFDLDLDTSG